MPGVTMDAGGLIALDRNDRRVVVLLARARETGARATVPATILAQAIRKPDRQVRLSRLIRQPTTDVIELGRVDATNVGRLLAASGTRRNLRSGRPAPTRPQSPADRSVTPAAERQEPTGPGMTAPHNGLPVVDPVGVACESKTGQAFDRKPDLHAFDLGGDGESR